MYNFCTLFDSNYMSRGLALYQSLLNTDEQFKLYIFCFDEQVFSTLCKMKLKHAVLISLEEFETDDLLKIKTERSRAEYCWTCTPQIIKYSIDKFNLPEVTYVDADIYFFDKPSILLNEFAESGCSVMLTEHRYSKKYSHLLYAGIYCVQFMTFKANTEGMTVLEWWKDRCLEWCFDRFEDGKFGDQKYLDDWPERFKGVYVLKNPGGGIAPWNIQDYYLIVRSGTPYITKKGTSTEIVLVFYHFHHLRFYRNGYVEFGHYTLCKEIKRLLYKLYLERLDECREDIRHIDQSFDPHGPVEAPHGFVKVLGRLHRKWKGNYLSIDNLRRL